MKKILIVLFSFISFTVKCQVYQSMPQWGYGPVKRFDIDSSLTIPTTCGIPTLRTTLTKKAAIAFDSCNNKFYKYNPKTAIWSEISGGGSSIDTTSLSNRINSKADTSALSLKLNISDTLLMLNSYLKKIDTSSLSNRIDLKVPYIGANADVDLGVYQLNAQSVKINGTAGNGHIDLKHQSSNATATGSSTALFANSNGDLKWKNDNKHYTTLTTQQTADRVYTFQNKSYTLADSADVAGKVNISDTSSMLTNYVRSSTLNGYLQKSDSSTYYTKYRSDTSRTNIYNAINLRVKYTDTASLSSRIDLKLNKTDTTSLSTRIDLRVKYTDTSSMLTPYLKKIDTAYLSSKIDAKGYTLSIGHIAFTYVASTTYYFGSQGLAATTTQSIRRIYIPQSGTIKSAYLYLRGTNISSTENWTISIRLNASSSTTLATVGNTSIDKVFSNTGLNISVIAGDYIEIITTTPAWTSSPGTTFAIGNIFIQ